SVDSVDAKVIKYPCQACAGSGKYRGVRTHQARSDCFACGGRGYFLTSERDRREARQKRQVSKQRKLREAREAFDASYPDVTPFLAGASWSPFACELLGKLNQYASLSERQVAAVRSMAAKCAERQVQRNAERNAGNTTVDLSPIRAMFETAHSN